MLAGQRPAQYRAGMDLGLFLVGYDVADERRRAHVFERLALHRVGGQKSLAECLLTRAQRTSLEADLDELIVADEDRLLMLSLDPRGERLQFGVARSVPLTDFVLA